VLAVGGVLVFSTCTINPGENEGNVRWLLERYPQMRLVEQSPRLGGPGLTGGAMVPCSMGGQQREEWLDVADAAKVQRFDTSVGVDSIAFFIAKLEKTASIPDDDLRLGVPAVLGAIASSEDAS
jgi:methyltransferase NSUN6